VRELLERPEPPHALGRGLVADLLAQRGVPDRSTKQMAGGRVGSGGAAPAASTALIPASIGAST
jgi:hypothetical protein